MWLTNGSVEGSRMGSNSKQQTQRQRPNAKLALTATFMTSFIIIGLIPCVLERVQCVIQQQQTSSGVLSNDNNGNNQDTLSSFRNGLGAGGAYSAFVDGVDGNNGFMGWARNTYANTNNKRARKMSAFMPMRGRKDGRDEPSVGSARNDLTVGYNDNPMSDSNRGDSDSVHDWIAASTLSPSLWSSNGDNIQSIEQSHQFVGTPVPLQFANQVAAHRLQQRLMAQPRSAPEMIVADNDGGIVSSSAGDPMTSSGGPLSLAPGAFERTNLAPGSSAGVMQAKLRRAFHPMRGKKWASNDASASIDQVVNEIALARNGGLDM